jgi:formate dehydrogenase subunit gamma
LPKPWDASLAETIVRAHAALEGPLLPILHALNAEFGCVPDEATALIAEALNLSRAEVHGVISFYHDFHSAPRGRLVVKLCRAEACQAMGGREAAAALLEKLGLDWGGTSADGAVSIDPAYCLGLCATAPAALIGDAPAGRLDAQSLIARVEAAR